MLGRMRRLYGPRFFDVVTVDAWYTKTPFLRAVRRLCSGVVSVLKQERFEVYQESSTLAAAQSAERFDSGGRQIALREVRDLTLTEEGQEPVRVILANEEWIQPARVAGRKVCKPMNRIGVGSPLRNWMLILNRRFGGIGHYRWAIENHVFNELTQHYHLEHCPHHHPVAIIARLLILVLGFNLFEVFVRLHGKLWQCGKVGLLELAIGLDRSLEYPDQLVPL
jgi:hypothetical protein